METPIYSEKQRLKYRLLLVIAGVSVLLFGVSQSYREEPIGALAMLLFAVVFVVILLGFTEFNTIITATELRFGFPLFRKRFQLSELNVGDIEKIAVLAGIGIHYWSGKWVYNARFGDGVNITHGRRRYLIGSNHPYELQHKLMELIPQGAVPK